MGTRDLEAIAVALDKAALLRQPVAPPSETAPLSLAEAYCVQSRLIATRLARGERIIGLKMGFTSEAMRRQMNVEEPNCGWLTDRMLLSADAPLDLGRFIHPRAEPEVAIRLARDLPADADTAATEAAVEACAPAIEIVDSRFPDYRFTLADNTADNSSAAALVIGPWRAPMELGRRGVQLLIDGEVVAEGATDAVFGHPLRSLKEAARLAAAQGRPLTAGMIVITGGVTAAPYIGFGRRIETRFEGLGDVGFAIGGSRVSPPLRTL